MFFENLNEMKKKVIITGAGIAGIAVSIRLACKSFQVDVFETAEKAGGKLNEFYLGDFRFDLGPSLFTLPEYVLELFQLAGKDYRDYFDFQKIELACRYFWEDQTRLDAWSDPEKFAEEASAVLQIDKQKLKSYLKHNREIYKLSSPVFLERSLHSWKGLFNKNSILSLFKLRSFRLLKTMDQVNRKKLKHPKLVQLFNRMATYNGSSPFLAPGILTIISSLEHGSGVYFPKGGMYSITKALVQLAEELGVKFHYSEKVTEITRLNKKVSGVKTTKSIYHSDFVISNGDVVPTYLDLLPDIKPPSGILKNERSSSAIVFYWGMNKVYKDLDLHNIFFSEHYEAEFDHIFRKKEIIADPTIYVHSSTKAEANDAPEGCETWFVMVNAPASYGQDWERIINVTRENVIRKLERNLNQKIREHISKEWILHPGLIEEKTASYRGALYGSSSNSVFSAFLRHPNFSNQLKDLYFAGGSVHPGGGIPLCLLSAKIVAGMIS